MDLINIISRLTSESGVSGCECVLDGAKELLSEYAEVSSDALGNIIGTVGKSGKHIMLDAHADRIGLVVTAIDSTGFLRIDKCGGVDTRVLAAADVTIHGKKPLFGVITSTPPHLAKPEDKNKALTFDTMAVDTGLPFEEVKKHVSVGDRITVNGKIASLNSHIITGAALDDRIGMAALLRVLDILNEKKSDRKVSVVFSVQEEVTGSGCKTSAFSVSPDEAIAVDVSFAEAPGIKPTECGKLGNGGMICISPSISGEMSEDLMKIASEKGIKYQNEICQGRTGTNADSIASSKCGVKTGLVSIPLRNMHTQSEIADIDDIDAVAQLIAEYIMAEEGKNNA